MRPGSQKRPHKLLSDHNVAAVVVDEPLLPLEVRLTSDIAYIRWHGRGEKMWYNYRYSREELAEWVPKIREMSKSMDVYGYFNNHYHGYAPENCIDILEMPGMATPEQKEARQRISGYWKGKATTKAVSKTLSDFLPQEKEDITTLLSGCIDASRLEKAREINDIEIIELGADKIVADVRGYSVYIDIEKRFILHDCGEKIDKSEDTIQAGLWGERKLNTAHNVFICHDLKKLLPTNDCFKKTLFLSLCYIFLPQSHRQQRRSIWWMLEAFGIISEPVCPFFVNVYILS